MLLKFLILNKCLYNKKLLFENFAFLLPRISYCLECGLIRRTALKNVYR